MSQALIDELSKAEYATLSDQAAADLINAKTVAIRKPVDLWMVVEHSSRNGYRAKLELARTNGNHPCQETAINILEYINSPRLQTVDMDLPSTRGMVQALVQCQFATQSMADELLALADQTIKWTESIGLGSVDDREVARLRERMNLGVV
jgi:hypothetical protein